MMLRDLGGQRVEFLKKSDTEIKCKALRLPNVKERLCQAREQQVQRPHLRKKMLLWNTDGSV